MKLSIIIPTYQRNDKLKRLLKSIHQHSDVQIIVIDDSHNFESKSLFLSFPYIEFYQNRKGKGAGGARNTGIEYAKGAFLLFADSDDIFQANWFDVIAPYLSSHNDVTYFPPSSFLESDINSQGSRHLRYLKLIDSYRKFNNKDIHYYFYVPWSKMYKRAFLNQRKIRFEEIPVSNDINFSLNVGLQQESFEVSNQGFYLVEQGSSSLIKRREVSNLICRLEALFRYNETLDKYKLSNKKLMMAPWLFKLFKANPHRAFIYLAKGLVKRSPIIFDHRFKK